MAYREFLTVITVSLLAAAINRKQIKITAVYWYHILFQNAIKDI